VLVMVNVVWWVWLLGVAVLVLGSWGWFGVLVILFCWWWVVGALRAYIVWRWFHLSDWQLRGGKGSDGLL